MRKKFGYVIFILVCVLSMLTAAGYLDLNGMQSIFFVVFMAIGTVLAITLICTQKTESDELLTDDIEKGPTE